MNERGISLTKYIWPRLPASRIPGKLTGRVIAKYDVFLSKRRDEGR
jgi:hypothetical protein